MSKLMKYYPDEKEKFCLLKHYHKYHVLIWVELKEKLSFVQYNPLSLKCPEDFCS